MRILLTVLRNRKSATAEDGNRKDGYLLAFSAIPASDLRKPGQFSEKAGIAENAKAPEES